MSKELYITNPDADFLTCKNYLLQLCADGVLSPKDYVLYCFYKSVFGWRDETDNGITLKFEYISRNTGLSHSSIQRSLRRLLQAKVAKSITRNGMKGYKVILVPDNELPQRKLYPVTRKVSSIEVKEDIA